MQHHLLCDVSSVTFLLTEIEAEIATEDVTVSLPFCASNSLEALSVPVLGLGTDPRAAPRLCGSRRFVLEARSGRCHRYACRFHQHKLWI